MHNARAGRHVASVEDDPIALDALDMPEAHDVPDLPDQVELVGVQHRAAEHGRPRRGVDPDHPPDVLELVEHLVEVVGLRRSLDVMGDRLERPAHLRQRLEVGPIVEPCLSWADPPNPVGVDILLQQPDAGVDGGLAATEDRDGVRCRGVVDETVDGHHPGRRGHRERRGARRGHRGLEVASVDDLPPGRQGSTDYLDRGELLATLDPESLPAEPEITAITLAELSVGPHAARTERERAARQAHLQQAEADFEPLPFDAAAARAFGRVAASLRGAGRKPAAGAYDALIAAVALANGLDVYTGNANDFNGIDGLMVHEVRPLVG